MSARPPRISVVMVSWRTGPVLAQAAAAALAAPDVDELVLVNNGNPPEMEARLRALAAGRDDVALVEGQGNVGFARACNLGAAAARGDLLLFLNPDTVIAPGAAAAMAAATEIAARPAIVGARLLNPDGGEQRGARRAMLTPLSTLASLVGLDRLRPGWRLHREAEALPDGPIPVPVVSGAALMLRADDFRMLDGFDEGYFLHVEDVDLCRRAGAAGGTVIFAPGALVTHHGATSDASALGVEWSKAKGFVRYFRKFARGPLGGLQAALIAPPVVLAIMGRAVLLRAGRRRGG